jgi:3-deoxy-D-manno-octulosonic acid kinase
VSARLPDFATGGFVRERSGGRIVVVAEDFAEAVRGLDLLGPGALDRLLAGGADRGGRGRNVVVSLPGRSERLHVRSFRHGGWLARPLGGRLAGTGRPLAELAANARLHAAGAPVPRPVLVAGERRAPGIWHAAVGTVHVEASRNAGDVLAAGPEGPRLLSLARAAGESLRRFHDAGGRHADLHVGNLLVRPLGELPRVCIVDLDRARLTPRVPPARRLAEIMRLHRSLVKRGLDGLVSEAAVAAFLDGYTAGDRRLRAALLAYLPRERRRLALHRLGYARRGGGRRDRS